MAWGATSHKSGLEKIYYKHSTLHPDELIVDILYTGLCHSDHFKLKCLWTPPERSKWPMVAGHEIIGRVKEIGSNVETVKVGDIVGACPKRSTCGFCKNCKMGDDNICMSKTARPMYDPHFGGYAT